MFEPALKLRRLVVTCCIASLIAPIGPVSVSAQTSTKRAQMKTANDQFDLEFGNLNKEFRGEKEHIKHSVSQVDQRQRELKFSLENFNRKKLHMLLDFAQKKAHIDAMPDDDGSKGYDGGLPETVKSVQIASERSIPDPHQSDIQIAKQKIRAIYRDRPDIWEQIDAAIESSDDPIKTAQDFETVGAVKAMLAPSRSDDKDKSAEIGDNKSADIVRKTMEADAALSPDQLVQRMGLSPASNINAPMISQSADGSGLSQAEIDAMPDFQHDAYMKDKGTSKEWGISDNEKDRRQTLEGQKALAESMKLPLDQRVARNLKGASFDGNNLAAGVATEQSPASQSSRSVNQCVDTGVRTCAPFGAAAAARSAQDYENGGKILMGLLGAALVIGLAQNERLKHMTPEERAAYDASQDRMREAQPSETPKTMYEIEQEQRQYECVFGSGSAC